MVVLKIVVPPSVVVLLGRIVYIVAFVLILSYNIGLGRVGLPGGVLGTGL